MFDININCIIFGVSEPMNKKCILSLSDKEFIPPHFILDQNHIENINSSIIEFLKQYIFVNELELMPQLISLHNPSIKKNDSTLESVYGFIVNYKSSINTKIIHWIDFNPMQEHKFSHVVLDTLHKLS